MPTKKPKQMWLVYRPVHDYEESMEPYFVCPSKEVAEAAALKMNTFLEKLKTRLPDISNICRSDEWTQEWQDAYDRRESMLEKARWPFGINLKNDVHRSYCKTVDCMALDLRETT